MTLDECTCGDWVAVIEDGVERIVEFGARLFSDGKGKKRTWSTALVVDLERDTFARGVRSARMMDLGVEVIEVVAPITWRRPALIVKTIAGTATTEHGDVDPLAGQVSRGGTF